jgi:hypothetical protein
LVSWAWYQASGGKVKLEPYTGTLWSQRNDTSIFTKVNSYGELQAGDLILRNGHVAIAVDSENEVEAMGEQWGVVKKTLKSQQSRFSESRGFVYLRPVVK